MGLHTPNQSSCNTLRGIPLKTLEQKAQREARKWIESQRFSEFLALSSKILAFLSLHTTQIKAMHTACHKTILLLEDPKPLNFLHHYPLVCFIKYTLASIQTLLQIGHDFLHDPSVASSMPNLNHLERELTSYSPTSLNMHLNILTTIPLTCRSLIVKFCRWIQFKIQLFKY